MLEDIAILTGATLISEEQGVSLEDVDLTMLGNAETISINKDNTVIVNGSNDPDKLNARINQIKGQIEAMESPYEKELLQQRLAKLAGGVAVLYVGAASEIEMREKKDRIDDALAATRAAVEEGIVPGGGIAYIRAKSKLLTTTVNNADEKTGVMIIVRAIEAPFKTICENAGVSADVKLEGVMMRPVGSGYNAKDDNYVEMLDAGIIDPCKVTRIALENAASVAGMILTTECALLNTDNKPSMGDMPEMPGGMPGMM